METSELLKKVRHIEIKTRGLSNHLFAGEYHSTFKGRGMSFSEVREYQYGDEIRAIDWNVTARFNHPFVKVFEEERELTVMFLIDLSQSDFFGTKSRFKNELITEIAAVLSFSAIKNNDKVGMIFFSDRVEKFIPPKKGKKHILMLIRDLLKFQPQNHQTNIAEALRYFNNIMKKRSIAFLMSDFLDKNYEKALSIAARKHDLVGFHVHDIRERELPDIGLVRFRDAESGHFKWVNTSSQTNRERYTKFFDDHQQYLKSAFLKSGADLIPLRTDQPYVHALINFFKSREKR
jgi:uncharacterized protein (DUF58 family)